MIFQQSNIQTDDIVNALLRVMNAKPSVLLHRAYVAELLRVSNSVPYTCSSGSAKVGHFEEAGLQTYPECKPPGLILRGK